MADGMDGFDRWLRQRLAATLDDAARVPRRRLLLPGAAASGRHPRRDGFLAGVATTAVFFGVLWAAVNAGLHHGRSVPAQPNAAGRVVSSVSVPDAVFSIAAAEGGVWVPDANAGTLLRIDPRSGRITATITISTVTGPRSGFDTVATSPGAVWVTSGADDALLRIDPSSNTVAQRIPLGMRPSSLAVLGGDVWVTGSQANRVLRVSVATGDVLATVPVTDPRSVAGGDGAVWVVSELEGVLSRIDPATNRAQAFYTAVPDLDYVIDAVTAVDDGVWVRNLAAQSVEHVSALSASVTQHADVGGGATLGITDPQTITSTPGAVWTTISNSLVRIDTRTLSVAHLTLVDPTGVAAAADGTVWVATAQGTVVHVAPS